MNNGFFPDLLQLPEPALPEWMLPPLFPQKSPMAQTFIPPTRPVEPETRRGFYMGKREDGSKFILNPQDYAQSGERDAILASSGMGKSYLTGVLLEETLENGGMVCVVDPEGEHYTLAERYPILVIGGEHGKIPLETEAIAKAVAAMLESRISLVFDLSEYVDDEQQSLYASITETLFQAQRRYRRKMRLVVEEAQIYAPQSLVTTSLQVSQKIAKRGRKRGIDSVWATQRPASLNKDILSQCNRFWFGGIQAEQDYKAIKPFLNDAGITFSDLKTLEPGEFYCYARKETHRVKIRKRYCRHAGSTPTLENSIGKPASQQDVERIADALCRG